MTPSHSLGLVRTTISEWASVGIATNLPAAQFGSVKRAKIDQKYSNTTYTSSIRGLGIYRIFQRDDYLISATFSRVWNQLLGQFQVKMNLTTECKTSSFGP